MEIKATAFACYKEIDYCRIRAFTEVCFKQDWKGFQSSRIHQKHDQRLPIWTLRMTWSNFLNAKKDYKWWFDPVLFGFILYFNFWKKYLCSKNQSTDLIILELKLVFFTT